MAEHRLSRQELIRRQRRSGFIGRQGELTAFKDVLKQQPEEAAQFLFHVRGPAGVGKSTLVRQMEGAAREAQAITAYLDESVADAIEVMEAVSTQFAQQGLPMKAFDKRLGIYRQRRHEADASAAATIPAAGESAAVTSQDPTGPVPSPTSVVASQLGLVGLGMIPGVGAFTGAIDPQQVAAGATQLKAILSTRFSNRDDVQLILSPLQELTPLFLRDLSEVAQRRSWIVLFFDTYERTGSMLNSWLCDVLLSDKYGELPANVLAILAGQSRLEERYWGDFIDLVTDLPLEVFTEAEARRLLATKGLTDERVIEVILHLSGRLPVLVSTLAESRPTSVEEVGDPSGTAVERFLKWEPDPARRAAALACALPQELNEDIYRATVDDEAADFFGWLQSMPFVNSRAGHCRYHDVVRGAMLRLQRQQSPSNWVEQHDRLAASFQQRRIKLEDGTSPAGSWWEDDQWRNFRIQETYHRLCANSRTAFPIALGVLIDAYTHNINAVRRWAQVFIQAGEDADASGVRNFGQKFLESLEEESAAGVNCLTFLLTCDELIVQDRARVLALRGRNQRESKNFERALRDYSAAIKLDPSVGRFYVGRGLTYRFVERYDDAVIDFNRALELEPDKARTYNYRGLAHFLARQLNDALADFDRSLELEPDDAATISLRGLTYSSLKRYEDALVDFNRVLELEPEDAGFISLRGLLFHALERHDDALDDFNHALELEPDSELALACRGLTYSSLERYEDALVDFNRALELGPDNAMVYASRGRTYQSMERYEDALVDFNRALELGPDDAMVYASRGRTYQSMERYEDALVDFNRALELGPDDAMVYASRGRTYQSMERYEDALVDFNRALELGPDDAMVYARRGRTYQSLKRYEDALVDFNRALELGLDEATVYTSRGLTYQSLERYQDALVDLNRALELDPDSATARICRGGILHSLERYDDALADFNRALEIDSQNSWAYSNRGDTYDSMGRYDDALADFNRALEIDSQDSWAYAKRGDTYDSMGRYDDALADFNRALEIDSQNSWAYSNRGDTYDSMGRYDDALADYDRALELTHDDAHVLTSRGLTYRLMGRYDDALADFNRALEIDSQNSWAYTSRGQIFRQMGQYDDALADLDRAIELDLHNGWTHYEKSVVLHAKLHRDRKKHLARAIKVIARDIDGISKKGNLFLSSCLVPRWQKAEHEFTVFMSSDPAPGRVKELLMAINGLIEVIPSRRQKLMHFSRQLEDVISESAQQAGPLGSTHDT